MTYEPRYDNYPPDVDLVAIGVAECQNQEPCPHEHIVNKPDEDPYCECCGEYQDPEDYPLKEREEFYTQLMATHCQQEN